MRDGKKFGKKTNHMSYTEKEERMKPKGYAN